MLLAYVDESYNKTRYWIAAFVCPEAALNPLAAALDGVVRKAVKAYGGASDAELHGYELFHGERDWEHLKLMPRARIGVYAGALSAIAEHPVEIIVRGVDPRLLRKRYSNPWHPHAVVMGHLLERVDERAEAHDQFALVIADEVDDAAAYRRDLWVFQRASTPGYRARQLTRIADTIHFAPSRASRLLQAADLLAFLHQRIHVGERDDRARRANRELWRLVSERVVNSGCWFP